MFGTNFGMGTRDPAIEGMQKQINNVCAKHHSNYQALFVSWNDNQRQQGSCWGSNITDARLKGKDGEDFLVLRPQNFNERIGRVRASDIALLAGRDSALSPITLEQYLKDFHAHGAYAGSIPPHTSLLAAGRDQSVGIRFQAVFLPVPASDSLFGNSKSGVKEFYPDTYNYQTHSWEDPKNMVLLCTSQGTFVQQDGPGSVPQYLHKQENGQWRKKYLEAMMTRHVVSMGQTESQQEREDALKQGKAVSTVIGTRAMGTGFNRLMTIQIPMKKQERAPSPFAFSDFDSFGSAAPLGGYGMGGCFGASDPPAAWACAQAAPASMASDLFGGSAPASMASGKSALFAAPAREASAYAARVSTGSDAGPMEQLKMTRFQRDDASSITITVQFYFVVEKGCAIKEADITRAIDVCEEAYKGCSWDGHLMDPSLQAAFAKKDLTLGESKQISSFDPLLNSTLNFPSTSANTWQPAPIVKRWPDPPKALSSAFDVLHGLDSELRALIASVPAHQDGYAWLHQTALDLLSKKEDLDSAYHLFRLANDLHVQMRGKPDGMCLYNMSCCQTVAVSLQIEKYRSLYPSASCLASCTGCAAAAGGLVAPRMPPTEGMTVAALCESRLDAALTTLAAAIGAGWRQHGHMLSDPDLKALQELRRPQFDTLVQLAKSL
ncbi:unnamed protein product [Effrenium voratum]|nr:unnamed protein product [Effrenium voratum]